MTDGVGVGAGAGLSILNDTCDDAVDPAPVATMLHTNVPSVFAGIAMLATHGAALTVSVPVAMPLQVNVTDDGVWLYVGASHFTVPPASYVAVPVIVPLPDATIGGTPPPPPPVPLPPEVAAAATEIEIAADVFGA